MANVPGAGRQIVPSLLDRLIDLDPEHAQERPKSPAQEMRELRDGVVRDVGNLLNTRCRWPPPDPSLTELATSLADYGVPDFTGADLSTPKAREAFRAVLQAALRRYEPRFKTVKVEILPSQDPGDRTLRFRVDALLHADPVPETVVFDSVVDPVSGGFEVEGGGA